MKHRSSLDSLNLAAAAAAPNPFPWRLGSLAHLPRQTLRIVCDREALQDPASRGTRGGHLLSVAPVPDRASPSLIRSI